MWGSAAGEEFAGAHTAGKSLEGCGFMKQYKNRGENEVNLITGITAF